MLTYGDSLGVDVIHKDVIFSTDFNDAHILIIGGKPSSQVKPKPCGTF